MSLLCCPLLLLACGQGKAPAHCGEQDRSCANAAKKEHAARNLAYWAPSLKKPITDRIAPAPAELVDYIRLDNIANGYPERPKPAVVTPDFMQDVFSALAEMPEPVRRRLGSKLLGIYFVDGLGGTGFTEQILDDARNPVAGIVVLDASVLAQRTANTWASWKEASPFKEQAGYGLSALIEEPATDNRKNAIQYILLHEFGHVLSINQNFHPSWDERPQDVKDVAAFPFFALSWIIAPAPPGASSEGGAYNSRFDSIFPQRKNVVFYFGSRLNGADATDTYAGLERTNFASLYGATSPGDDFAEAFANYVHVVMMNKPYRITMTDAARVSKVYESCWAQARCAEKRHIIEKFFGER